MVSAKPCFAATGPLPGVFKGVVLYGLLRAVDPNNLGTWKSLGVKAGEYSRFLADVQNCERRRIPRLEA